MKKEKLYGILVTIFAVLTFIGAVYIITNKGEVNAGYAVVPGLWTMIFSNLLVMEKKKNNDEK